MQRKGLIDFAHTWVESSCLWIRHLLSHRHIPGQAQDYQLCGHGATPGNIVQKQPPPCVWWAKTRVERGLSARRFSYIIIQPIYCSFICLDFTETDMNHTSLGSGKKCYSKTQGRARGEGDGTVFKLRIWMAQHFLPASCKWKDFFSNGRAHSNSQMRYFKCCSFNITFSRHFVLMMLNITILQEKS